jgi:non-heme chloroperoxidase
VNQTIGNSSFTTSDGVRLNLLEAGDPSSKGVIAFVPGWSMPAWLWRAQLAALAGRYRVAALDPRGQGESDVPLSGYEIERRADDLAEFLARYQPGVVVGWSLGALEALHCLHRHGEDLVRALVIVDSSVGEAPATPPNRAFREALVRDRSLALDEFVRALFSSARPDPEIAALHRQAQRMPLESSLALFPSRLPSEHWRDTVERFTKPLLYAVTPRFAAQAQQLQRRRPSTRIEIFADAGHALFVDEPERFSGLLGEFADSVFR